MAVVAKSGYGKSHVRLIKVTRAEPQHDIFDLTVDIRFEGAYDPSYTAGDNTIVLPTDTMKNTVYALARQHTFGDIETFGRILGEHFLRQTSHLERVRVAITEHAWNRISVKGRPHRHAFLRAGSGNRTAHVTTDRIVSNVSAGITDLMVLKTDESAFDRFLKDEYTTLRETRDRIFATVVNATWIYTSDSIHFSDCWRGVREALLSTFAEHKSESVQHTLYAMGEAALAVSDSIAEITMSLPNKHHLLVDLTPFGLENDNEIFVATDAPYGLIEATIRR